jgi:hypothetical protein
MATLNVGSFSHGHVSDDGMTITVDLELTDGATHQLVIPFQQLDWVTQALLNLGQGAYLRQVERGVLSAANPIDAAMVATAVRVLPNTSDKNALIQMIGRTQPNEPLGMGSVVLGGELLRDLLARLTEVAEQLRQQH